MLGQQLLLYQWDPCEGMWDLTGAVLVGTLDMGNSGEVASPAPDLANPVALSPCHWVLFKGWVKLPQCHLFRTPLHLTFLALQEFYLSHYERIA